MSLAERLRLHSITTQITGIVAVSVLLGLVLVVTSLLVFFDHNSSDPAARIAKVTLLVKAAESPDEAAAIVAAAQRAGMKVTRVGLTDLETPTDDAQLPFLARRLAGQLESNWGIDVIGGVRIAADGAYQLAVRVGDDSALLFDVSAVTHPWFIVLAPIVLTLTIVLVFVTLLSVYAVRWIIAPLSSIAAAAHSFGRSPDDTRIVNRSGPREIAQVADALNDMRTRIRALLDDRTRMLAAISHDLRTPLTRLRLRAERIGDQDLRDGMLHEITRVTCMLDETLDYLREDVRSESTSRIDLPSVLQTICAEFADVGHAVSYDGPARLTWTCRPSVLTRAISNVVDNAVKHGSAVTVALRARDDGAVEIDVADDGPGIPSSLREKVFDPFFKGDDARTSAKRSGFGLGLSIARDVVKGHGGEIDLLDRTPRGLIVRMSLPGDAHA
ncbi:MAG: HAMP domain-containing protein [Rhizobiales bacterium]|nr:HAMP domain-containing protein [Hyphomicrobiales bacterium]